MFLTVFLTGLLVFVVLLVLIVFVRGLLGWFKEWD